MKLRYSVEARAHIANIYRYIHERSPTAATQVVARIRQAAQRLCEFPQIGREGRVAGTHEWVVRGLPYTIVYQTDVTSPDEILILGVFHGAQDRDPQ